MSRHSQWLPSDVAIGSDGGVKFMSYINNMHPEWHAQLYTATSALLQRCIPLIERVLADAAPAATPDEMRRAIPPPEDITL